MNFFQNNKNRDWMLAGLGFVLVFGSGFAASHLLVKPNAVPTTALSVWEQNALNSLRQNLDIRPEQEEKVIAVLKNTEAAIQETRERASLEFHLQLLNAHEELAPHLDSDQQKKMLESRKKLAKNIRQKFSRLLQESGSTPPELLTP